MNRRDPADSIRADIQGDVAGQIAVGSYILQVGDVHGGIVNIAAPGQQPQPRERPAPVWVRPRPLRGWLDRQEELAQSLSAIRSGVPVEVSGEPGVGKTAFLRRLAHTEEASGFPHGVVYLSARRIQASDLLQSLFDTFYECPVPFKPTDAQLQLAFRGKRALVLLDDVDLPRNDLEKILDAAPECGAVVTSRERILWGEVQSIRLRGLPDADGVTLLERELGQTVTDADRPSAVALSAALGGHPIRLLQAAAVAREHGGTLTQVLASVKDARAPSTMAAANIERLDEQERSVLGALMAVGSAMPADALAALSDARDPEPLLRRLESKALIVRERNRYFLAPGVSEAAHGIDRGAWEDRALAFYLAWADRHRHEAATLVEESAPLVRMQEHAAGKGRWKDVLRIGGLVAGALALSGLWEAWAAVLQRNLHASQAIGDRGSEGLALHEAGTRALCLGETSTARQLLGDAISLRESLGDAVGASVSRHNAGLLVAPAPATDSADQFRSDAGTESPADSLPLLEGTPPSVVAPSATNSWLTMATVLLSVLGAGGLGWWLTHQGQQAPASARIVRFEARPSTIERGQQAQLCYEVVDAAFTRIDQAIGALPADRGQCVPVQPTQTTTYTLTATSADGRSLTGSTEIVVGDPPAAVPMLALTPEGIAFGSQVVRIATDPRTLIVSNVGADSVDLSGASVSGPNAGDFSIDDTACRAPLSAGDSCSIAVRFTPSTEGNRTAVVTINGDKPVGQWTASFSGAGIPPARPLASVPAAVDFGGRTVNSTSEPRFVIVNSRGSAPLRIGAAQVSGDHASDFVIVANRCTGAELPRESECAIEIRFTPSATGPRAGRLAVTNNADGSPQLIGLSGQGIAAAVPVARLTPEVLRFQARVVRQPGATQAISVTNTGNAQLIVNRVSVGGVHAGDFQIRGSTCVGLALAALASCTVEVAFMPLGTGPRSATIDITHNAGEGGRRVSLVGTALMPPVPVAGVRPTEVDFGHQVAQAVGPPRPVSLTNTGGGRLQVQRVDITGEHAGDFAVDNGCTSAPLERGETCDLILRFTPRGGGTRSAQVLLSSNADGPPQRIALAGIGDTPGRLDVQPTQIDFRMRPVRAPGPPQSVTLRNSGTTALIIERFGVTGANGSDFSVRQNCPDLSLPGGGTCALEARFIPSGPGARTATLTVMAANGDTREVSLIGSGEGSGQLVVTPAVIDFRVQPVRSVSGSTVVKVENTGTAPMTLGAFSIEGGDLREFQAVSDKDPCARTTLEPRQSCVIEVRFAPLTESGRAATLVVGDANGTVHRVLLRGIGRAIQPPPAGRLQVVPARLNFDRLTVREESKSQPISIRNVGDGPVVIGRLALAGRDPGDFVLSDRQQCSGSSLAPRAQCEVEVLFVPRSTGDRTAVLQVSDARQAAPALVSLGGTGTGSGGSGGNGINPPVRCADFAAEEIRFEITRRTGKFDGDVRITATLTNHGPGAVPSSSGGSVTLYEDARSVRRLALPSLSPGQDFSVSHQRHWNSSSSAEGEFPPRYSLEVNVPNDCNNGNNRMDRQSGILNEMFGDAGGGGLERAPRNPPTIVRFDAIERPPRVCYLVTGATSARIEPEIGAVRLAPQNQCIQVPSRTARYTLTAEGPGGRAVRQVTIEVERTVAPPVIEQFYPIDDKPGQPPAVCFLVTGAATARIEPEIGVVRLTGRNQCERVPPRTQTYTLTAQGPGGRAVRQVTVQVRPGARRGGPIRSPGQLRN